MYQSYYARVADYVPGYSGQARFVSGLAEQAIDAILRNSPRPPIILVQGDHGPGARWDCSSADPEKSDVWERMSILSAYYLPGDGARGLYPSITPVNSFRLVLGHYFGAKLDPLPDRNWFSSMFRRYEFVDVTDRCRSSQ
jgi:hypothetical protein